MAGNDVTTGADSGGRNNPPAADLPDRIKPTKNVTEGAVDQAAYTQALIAYNAAKAAADDEYLRSSDNRGDRQISGNTQRTLDQALAALNAASEPVGGGKTWTVGNKTFKNKDKAIAHADKLNEKNGWVVNDDSKIGKGRYTKPEGAATGDSGGGGDDFVLGDDAEVPDNSDKVADTDLGGDGAGQVPDAVVGGGVIAGVPDASNVAQGYLPLSDAVNPGQTGTAIDQFYGQLQPEWDNFTTGLDDHIMDALGLNTAENVNDFSAYADSDIITDALNTIYNPNYKPNKPRVRSGNIFDDITISDDPNAVYNFDSVLNDSVYDTVLSELAANDISNNLSAFNDQGFGYDPTTGVSSWASNLFNETIDDQLITDLLSGQETIAGNQLSSALSRGQISDAGYNYALEELASQGSAGTNALETIGSGLRTGNINDLLNGTTSTPGIASFYNTLADDEQAFGTAYDIGGTSNAIKGRGTELSTGFGDAFTNAVGDTQYFDIGSLLATASKKGGIFDPVAEGTAGGYFNQLSDNETKRKQSRGLGSDGSF